jgi:hypothetical protein
MNAFAHLSPHEFRRTRLGLARADLPQRHRAVDASELSLPAPSSRGIDWREKGAWSFSSALDFAFVFVLVPALKSQHTRAQELSRTLKTKATAAAAGALNFLVLLAIFNFAAIICA